MRYLLILQSLCAEMHGIASWLARQPGNEIMLALERSNHYPDIPGAERILLKKLDLRDQVDSQAACMGGFMLRAEKTAQSLATLAAALRKPDIILVYSANGSGFNPRANFPESYVVNYACDLTGLAGNQKKAASLLELMQTSESDLAFAFANEANCKPAPYILDTDYFVPVAGQKDRGQVVFWLKDRNRGEFVDWMDKIARLAQKGPSCVVFAPNKLAIQEAQARKIPGNDRITLICAPHRSGRKQLFSSASLFVCPSGRLNLDMLEAMACALPVMANHGDCLHLPEEELERGILEALSRPELLASTGKKCREYAVANHSEKKAHEHMEAILEAWRTRRQRA